MRLFLKYALKKSTVKRALKVAFLITPILTVFNHTQEIVEMKIGLNFWIQVSLTFMVPYCVSSYSSAMASMEEIKKLGRR